MKELAITVPEVAQGWAFDFGGHEVRALAQNGQPWFILSDICAALGIKNSRNVTSRLKANQVNTVRLTDGNRGNPVRTIISESGLYVTVLRSDSPNAQPFQEWVTEQVLPTIRKEGVYEVPQAFPAAPDFSALERLAGLTAQAIEHKVSQAIGAVRVEVSAEIDEKVGALTATSEQQHEVKALVDQIVRRRRELGLGRSHWASVYREAWDACRVGSLSAMTRDQFPKVRAYLAAELTALGAMSKSGLFSEAQAASA